MMLYFDFFGAIVEVHCVEQDAFDLMFFYSTFAIEKAKPELVVEVECSDWPERGFFVSLLANDKLTKRISITQTDQSKP